MQQRLDALSEEAMAKLEAAATDGVGTIDFTPRSRSPIRCR